MDGIELEVTFASGSERLAGKLGVPSGLRPGERRAGFVVMHGFGGNMESASARATSRLLQQLGYVTLRFDFRGCGLSTGTPGLVLWEDEVADTVSAISFLEQRPEVDPKRIGLLGASLAGGIAILTAAKDTRVAACISCGGVGNGETTLRKLHPAGEAWQRFTAMIEEGRRRRQQGQTFLVPRFDIVPIPAHLRAGLPPGATMQFPFEVAESILQMRPIAAVGSIAPRPLLLLHPASDPVVSANESIEMFRHAGQPADLHVFASDDHFMAAEDNSMSLNILKSWLQKHLPALESGVMTNAAG